MLDWVIYRPPKILKFSKRSYVGANYRDFYNAWRFLVDAYNQCAYKKNSQKHRKYYEFRYYAGYFSLGCMYNITKQAKCYHETDFTHIIHPPSCCQSKFKLTFRK